MRVDKVALGLSLPGGGLFRTLLWGNFIATTYMVPRDRRKEGRSAQKNRQREHKPRDGHPGTCDGGSSIHPSHESIHMGKALILVSITA